MTARVAALALALAACAPAAPATPADAVARYFRALARDPIRTLPLLGPRFHHEHGLHVVTTAEARAWLAGERAAEATDAGLAADSAALALDRLELAWLAVQTRPEFARLARALEVTPIGVELRGAEAQVTVRVARGATPAFEQVFRLARAQPDGAWRIESVRQRGVADESLAAAFAAHPTEATRRRLAAFAPRPRR